MSRYRVLELVLECEKLIEQHGHNGQWSMVNACTPQCEPILGTGGGKKKKSIMYMGLYAVYLTFGRIPGVPSSDGGVSVPPAMTPNLCID